MKERPILFSSGMVRAILDGSKTQTRRALKPQPDPRWNHVGGSAFCTGAHDRGDDCNGDVVLSCPYGKPGDRLWVRETFAIVPRTAYARSEGVQQTLRPDDDHDAAIYRAGWDRSNSGFRWRPSIHMPRWASRILLEIVSVRVERLQDISHEDALAEGIPPGGLTQRRFGVPGMSLAHYFDSARDAFSVLWESINGAGSWAANPWVWVVEFRRVEATEGER